MWTLFRETYVYDDAWCHAVSFFPSKEEAQAEADRMNKHCRLNSVNEYYFIRKTGEI